MHRIIFMLITVLCVPLLLHADTVGIVQGKLADPSGAFISGGSVRLVSMLGGQQRSAVTDAEGRFEFRFVEAGPYRISAAFEGFRPVDGLITVVADQSVAVPLRFAALADISTEVTVTESSAALDVHSASVQTGLSSRTVEHMAGASESLAALEAQTGTAWRSQEHLHIRGAHQVGFEVNGIAIPDQSLFGAITPFIDPRNIKYAEITSGGLLPEIWKSHSGSSERHRAIRI
jgi:hypothetical protein